jgi:hypothetical protein
MKHVRLKRKVLAIMPDYFKLHLSGIPKATSGNAVWSALAALPGFPDVLGVKVFSTNTATVSTAIVTLGGPFAAEVAVAWSGAPWAFGQLWLRPAEELHQCPPHPYQNTHNIVTYSSLSEHSHLWFAFPSQNTRETFTIVVYSPSQNNLTCGLVFPHRSHRPRSHSARLAYPSYTLRGIDGTLA